MGGGDERRGCYGASAAAGAGLNLSLVNIRLIAEAPGVAPGEWLEPHGLPSG